MTMCYYLMGKYMNVRWVRCELWVLELHAGGSLALVFGPGKLEMQERCWCVRL